MEREKTAQEVITEIKTALRDIPTMAWSRKQIAMYKAAENALVALEFEFDEN